MRKTEKIYYENSRLMLSKAKVVKIHERAIELDRTIAYAEGGGQESDLGFLKHIKSNKDIPFIHVKRIYGHDVKITDNHWVNVEGILLHEIAEEHLPFLSEIAIDDEIIVEIDPLRREKLSTSHTASHVLYMAIHQLRPDAIPNIVGCHIREGQARFDFNMERKFSPEDIQSIEEICNKLVDENNEILLYGSEVHPDARFWECKGEVIPCGGTHLSHTGNIGCIKVKRKGLGKSRERIICMLNDTVYTTSHYKKED